MAIDVSWGNSQKTYVYIEVIGKWEWNEYHESISLANNLIRMVDHPVCVVTHLTDAQAQMLPSNAFAQWSRSLHNTPTNMQTLILVPGQTIVQIFIDMAYRLFGRFITFKFRMASTVEQALEIVEVTHDDTVSQI